MKTIIAGSRTITQYRLVEEAVRESGFYITEVVSGGARGVDASGEMWAVKHGVPIKRFDADWKKYGKKAGLIRNAEMSEYAEALVAVWDGSSPGTADMCARARAKGLKIYLKVLG